MEPLPSLATRSILVRGVILCELLEPEKGTLNIQLSPKRFQGTGNLALALSEGRLRNP